MTPPEQIGKYGLILMASSEVLHLDDQRHFAVCRNGPTAAVHRRSNLVIAVVSFFGEVCLVKLQTTDPQLDRITDHGSPVGELFFPSQIFLVNFLSCTIQKFTRNFL